MSKETRVFGGVNDTKFWSDKPIQKGIPIDLVNEKSLIMNYNLNGKYIVDLVDGNNIHLYKHGESKAVRYIISLQTFNKNRK